jgi:enoyl-CoA hydratase
MTEQEEDIEFENVRVEIEEGVMLLTLDRPSKLNALNSVTLDELHEAVLAADEIPEIGAVIITGSPEARKAAFAAGADIAEMAELDVFELQIFARAGQEVLMTIETLGTPVIAAVNGLALGGGCELAMACHVRIAAEEAVFGQPEINLGLTPGFAGSQRLPRLVGRGPALEMLLTGDPISAADALRIGLVNRVVPGGQLMEAAREMARKMADKAPLAREMILDLVSRGAGVDLSQAQRMEADVFGSMASTRDTKEGMTAFLEKRKASWEGR